MIEVEVVVVIRILAVASVIVLVVRTGGRSSTSGSDNCSIDIRSGSCNADTCTGKR